MTLEELKRVRELSLKLSAVERKLQALKDSQQRMTPILDGFPKKKSVESRIELLAVAIIDTEKEFGDLDAELAAESISLERKIRKEFSDYTEQMVLILRYVYCYDFSDIAISSGYSERRIYAIHHNILGRINSQKCS